MLIGLLPQPAAGRAALRRIDGFSRLYTFARIMVPMARSGIAVAAVIAFLFSWNEYVYAQVLVTGTRRGDAAGRASPASSSRTPQPSHLAACLLLTLVPPLLVAFFLQRHIGEMNLVDPVRRGRPPAPAGPPTQGEGMMSKLRTGWSASDSSASCMPARSRRTTLPSSRRWSTSPPTQGKLVAERHGARYFPDYRRACSRPAAIDAFIVALPDTLHQETTCRLLEPAGPCWSKSRWRTRWRPPRPWRRPSKQAAAGCWSPTSCASIPATSRRPTRCAHGQDRRADPRLERPLHGPRHRLRMNGTSSPCFYLGVHDVDALQWIPAPRSPVYSRAVAKLMPSLGVKSEDAIFATCEHDQRHVRPALFRLDLPATSRPGSGPAPR